ncbi:MAG: aspartate aminotransferase family protein, partial [Deltaproteobacteria bacterium]|nr:aspartate aminotransferase family protein [Deltaproteobacteria bacterium]
MPLPKMGRASADLLRELDELQANDIDWKHGRAFSLAYHAGDDVYELAQQAYLKFLSANVLNVAAFPSLRKMQNDVVGWMTDLLHGDDKAAGFMTSGGTESLLLAVKAARTRGKQRGISHPEMVLPTTAHAAFEKGAEYFGVRSVRVPVGEDFRADSSAMARAVTPNTVLLAASAPQYPQGVIDPIAEIAALAQAHDINCHVDACMGGVT